MTLQRSAVAGDTNYIGTDIGDLRDNLADWIDKIDDTIAILVTSRNEVTERREDLDFPDSILDFIQTMIGELQRFNSDFERLFDELPVSIEHKHYEVSQMLYRRCRELDHLCRHFKAEHINIELRSETNRPLLDRIYEESRGMVLDLGDLNGFSRRLKALAEKQGRKAKLYLEDMEILHLKPNIFGLGINLNYLFKRIWGLYKSKQSRRNDDRSQQRGKS